MTVGEGFLGARIFLKFGIIDVVGIEDDDFW